MNMETKECILTRRSIRRYTEQTVSEEVLDALLEAIRWSPSWKNTQCWEVVVVDKPELKEKIAASLTDKNPATKAITAAPLLFIMCGRKGLSGYTGDHVDTDKGDWHMFDLGLACQNLFLAAHDLGLGTVCVGSYDTSVVDKLLGLPDDVTSVAIVPVGYPARIGRTPPRRESKEFSHLNAYNNRIK